jgi:hypothetical protein
MISSHSLYAVHYLLVVVRQYQLQAVTLQAESIQRIAHALNMCALRIQLRLYTALPNVQACALHCQYP